MNRVVYFSKGGNTKKIADAIADEVGIPSASVEQSNGLSSTEILFVGASIYAGSIDGKLRAFLTILSPSQVKKVALFGTSAGKKTALPEVKSILQPKGIAVLNDEFHCKGSFLLVNRGRPNEEDLKQAKLFARKICGESI